MTRTVVVLSYPQGKRVWVCGQRVHHGATGVALVAAAALGMRRRTLAAVGLALALHDRRDWRIWFSRECVPAGGELSVTERTVRPAARP